MAVSLRTYLNNKLKEKGMTVAQAKKNAGKYKSIAAAKKAGSLYYTDKNGKVMAAVYAEDLKKPMTSSPRPKARPKKVATSAAQPKVTTSTLSDTRGGRGDGTTERNKRLLDPKSPQNRVKPNKPNKKSNPSLKRRILDIPNPFLKNDKAKASKWKTWITKNKNNYVKDNGNLDMNKAMKDFRKTLK